MERVFFWVLQSCPVSNITHAAFSHFLHILEILYNLINRQRARHNASFYVVNRLPGCTIQDSSPRSGRFFCFPEHPESLWSHPAPYQRVQACLSPEETRPLCEADRSPPFSAEVKNAWSYTPSIRTCLHGLYRENCLFVGTYLLLTLIPTTYQPTKKQLNTQPNYYKHHTLPRTYLTTKSYQ